MIDIEKLENLPQRMGFIKQVKALDSHGDYKWSLTKSEAHPVNGYYPWSIVKRVLTNFYQKDVNEAFSHYCTLVPKYQQKFFWEEFEHKRRYRWDPWYLDENNCIQNDYLKPKYKGPYTIKSSDYQTIWVHKVPNFSKTTYDRLWDIPYWNRDNYEEIIVQGRIWSFASKNDPRYQRYYQEREKALRKQRKQEAKIKKEKEYCMLTKRELEIKRLSTLDIVNRDRHGFDETSFKGEAYHGQKRKKK